MSKNYIYKDYVHQGAHSMGGFPSHPIQQELFLRACIARSAEHMVNVDEIAALFLKYKEALEFQEALRMSGKSADAVARHMAMVICKLMFHGIEDIMLVKYQGIMQRMTNPDQLWEVVVSAYREKESMDGNPSTDVSTVSKEVVKHDNALYVEFITEQFNGDDLKARNDIKEMTRMLIAKQPIEPLMNMPFEGKYDVFNPKYSIFSLTDADVERYNNIFKAEGYPSEFLDPVGIKFKEYVTFAAAGDRTDAINTLVRVLRGEASKMDYQSFEGIVNVSPAQKFYAEMVGISRMIEQKTFGSSMGGSFGSIASHHARKHPQEKMSGILDPAKNIVRTLRTGNPRGEGGSGFHPIAPVEYISSNPFHHYSKDVKKVEPSYYNVPYESKQNVDVTDFTDESVPMGGLLDLLDPRNLYQTVRHGDPEGGSSGFNPVAPIKPSNIHRVLQKKNHQFVQDGNRTKIPDTYRERQFRDDELDDGRKMKKKSYYDVPDSEPRQDVDVYNLAQNNKNDLLPMEYDNLETNNGGSVPMNSSMRATISTTILDHPVNMPILQQTVPFRGHLHEHLGVTDEHLWTSEDLTCLQKAMNILMLRMKHDDRCAVFQCFITAFAEARRQVASEKEYKVTVPQKIHQLGIFHAVEHRDPSKSYLTKVPINLNAVAFMTFVMSGSVNDAKPHVAILKKLMEALLDILKKNPTRKAHAGVRYLEQIRRPTSVHPRDLVFQGAYPALTDIHNVSPVAVAGFLYHCIALLCNYSIYAYEEMNKIKGSSVFIGLPLSVLRN